MFDEKTPLPFGKYKGYLIADVPAVYLMSIYRSFKDDPTKKDLMEYVGARIDQLDPTGLLRPREITPVREIVLPKCSKKAYITRKEAKDALKKIRADKSTSKKPIRSYECPKCSYWHLTSKPLEKFSQEAKNGLEDDY